MPDVLDLIFEAGPTALADVVAGGVIEDDFLAGLCRHNLILECVVGFCCVLSANSCADELGKANLSEKPIFSRACSSSPRIGRFNRSTCMSMLLRKNLEGCKAVARRILLSVAPDEKKLQLAAGERRLFAFSKNSRGRLTPSTQQCRDQE
jgi:hypothetical protein